MFNQCFTNAKTINWKGCRMQKGYGMQINKPYSGQCNLNRNENVAQSVAPNVVNNVAHEPRAGNLSLKLPSQNALLPRTAIQPIEGLDLRATQEVTHAVMGMPTGVANTNPDMSSTMNPVDSFGSHKRYPRAPKTESRKTNQFFPKNIKNEKVNKIGKLEVVLLSREPIAPLQRNQLNVNLQSYCFMKERQNYCQSLDRMVYNMDVSPTYLLSSDQKNQLQAAMLKNDAPLGDNLLPIINDLVENEPDSISRKKKQQWKNYEKKDFLKQNCFGYYIDVMVLDVYGNYHPITFLEWIAKKNCFGNYADVMALDAFGNYHPVTFSDWLGMKSKQTVPRLHSTDAN